MGPTASLVTVRPVISLASGGPPTVTSPVYATVSPSLRASYFLTKRLVVVPGTSRSPGGAADGTATATRAAPGRHQPGQIPAARHRCRGRAARPAARRAARAP